MKRILGLAPNVLFLGLVSLLNDFSSEMIYAVMPAFLTVTLGAAPIFVGLLDGFADALASFLKIFSGWFSDRVGKRKVLAIVGYSLSVSTRFFLSLVGNFWQVFALRAVDRVGKGFRDSPRDALIAESVEKSELGKSFGYHRSMDTIGSVLGPVAAILLLPILIGGYRSLFFIGFLLGIVAIFAFFFVRDIPRNPNQPARALPFSFSLRSFSREFRLYLLSIFLFGLGFMPVALILLQSQSVGFGLLGIPVMYFIYSLSFIIFAIPLGKLSDRVGERKILVLGFIAAILSYAIFILFNNPAGAVLGFIVLGLYSAMTDGVARALASKLVGGDKLATGQGFLNASVGISSLIAGVIGGGIWTFYSPTAAFIYGIIMMGVGLIAFLVYNKEYGKNTSSN